MHKKREKKLDFETLKEQMLLYKKLGKTAEQALKEIAENKSETVIIKDNVCQQSQQVQQI